MPDAESTHASQPDTLDDHAAGHGHAPAAEPLGPVNVTAWAYAIAGAAIGALAALALFVARGN